MDEALKALRRFFLVVIYFICLVYMMLWLVSCKTQYVSVPEYHTEYHHTTDTLRERDSVFREHKTIIREADSAMIERLGLRLKDGERAILVLRKEIERMASSRQEVKHDTIIKNDSIRVPYPVERKLNKWEQFKVDIGGFVLILLALLLLLYLTRVWKDKRRARDSC